MSLIQLRTFSLLIPDYDDGGYYDQLYVSTKGSLIFLEGIEMKHWAKMGYLINYFVGYAIKFVQS